MPYLATKKVRLILLTSFLIEHFIVILNYGLLFLAKEFDNKMLDERLSTDKELVDQRRSFGPPSPIQGFLGRLRSKSPPDHKGSRFRNVPWEDSKPIGTKATKDNDSMNTRSPSSERIIRRSRNFELQKDSNVLLCEQLQNIRSFREQDRSCGKWCLIFL